MKVHDAPSVPAKSTRPSTMVPSSNLTITGISRKISVPRSGATSGRLHPPPPLLRSILQELAWSAQLPELAHLCSPQRHARGPTMVVFRLTFVSSPTAPSTFCRRSGQFGLCQQEAKPYSSGEYVNRPIDATFRGLPAVLSACLINSGKCGITPLPAYGSSSDHCLTPAKVLKSPPFGKILALV